MNNLGGGYLLIGIEERDGRPVLPPVGVDPSRLDTIQKEILHLGHTALRPAYHPIIVPFEYQERMILILWATGGQTRPYKARLGLGKQDREYGYFIRKGSSTVRAKGHDEMELLSLAATVPFDDRINQQASINDLSVELMRGFLKDIGSDLAPSVTKRRVVEVGRQMGIIGGSLEALFPRNVGLLFFHAEPHRFFPATQIDVLKELRFTEGRATGIPKILRAMAANGSPPPEFEFDEDHTYFQVRLPAHPAFAGAQALIPGNSDDVTPEVTPEVKMLLKATRGEMTRRELQGKLRLADEKRPSKNCPELHGITGSPTAAAPAPGQPLVRLSLS